MITNNQFKVLYFFYKRTKKILKDEVTLTNENLSEKLEISLKEVNEIINDMLISGLINDKKEITKDGIKVLEKYKVKNAVIMAAGMSSRFAPLSYEKPKGLLIVKNQVLIERQIEQLQEQGIMDITIVVGYKKEMFFYLEDKYNVRIVINEDYYKYNNPSTLIRVKEKLGNTYVCSSDNYFTENVFEPYVYKAYYASVFEVGKTNEYCIETDEKDRIIDVKVGGESCWYMLGHVYFSNDFAKKFVEILEKEYENQITKEQLWENLYIRYIKELDMEIKKYSSKIVKEFDSLEELREFDENYKSNTNSKIIKNICSVLSCKEYEVIEIESIKKGLTNTSFKFTLRGKKYIYRHPGHGTESYINRISEEFSMKLAKKLDLDDTFIYMNKEEGWKISSYIEDARTLDYHNEEDVNQALNIIKKLHDAKIKSEYDFGIWNRALDFIQEIEKSGYDEFDDFKELFQKIKEVYEYTECDNIEKILCHCDCYDPNFLIDKNNKMYLIDWEYSGNDDPANDLGTFICCSDYSHEEALNILQTYFGRELTLKELRHYLGYIAISSYYWYVWAIYQESIGNPVGEYLYIWYKAAKEYSKKALLMYKEKK